jgi:dTDP-4-amino-4,6-dideoxygalactose transaminase
VSWTATATVAAIERAGATPVLVDIEADTFTLDPEELEKTLAEYLEEPGCPPLKAILPVHLYGQPADLPVLARLARAHGLRLIEDCAQSHGATLDGRMTGTWGDLAAFSFYPTKNLGAFGDAGAVVTTDDALAERVHRLREYGWEPRQVSATPGVNSRLDELQAAILRVLLPHLPAENLERQRLARRYDEALAGTRLRPPPVRANARHAWHQYVIRTGDRDALKAFLQARGLATQIHYPVPVHRQPAYAGRLWHSRRGLPRTEAATREVLSLPMSPHLPEAHVEHLLAALALWEEGRGRR